MRSRTHFEAPSWWRTWLLCVPVVGIGVPAITLTVNTPTLPWPLALACAASALAGMALALAADIRLASRSARFLNAAVRLGLTAGESGMSYMLPRLIGAARAFEILITGRPVDAEEAERIGLVARLVDDFALLADAEALARQILENSPFATKHTKRLIWQNLDAPSFAAAVELENRTQMLASLTDDYKEATAAFTDRRPAQFKGR